MSAPSAVAPRLALRPALRPALASIVALAGCSATALAAPANKALFDATKAQMAGNADWVIDADTHNLGTSSSTHLMVTGAGTESNPQRFPTPAASGITPSTPETYWTGALSSWGIELVKRGFSVETLPYNGAITYGNASNPQDLSNYGIYIIDEPNISFTAAEKTAIINFVSAGGGLFIISDHNNSDRNSDGVDSVDVLNDLVTNNGVSSNVFGITFNYVDVSPTSTFVATSGTDPLIHGAAGAVSQMIYHNGATLTITGSNTHGAIWQTSARASSSVMVAYATYGLGKVVACGDSSPFDDGTGDSNDSLFNGWSGEANGDHGRLAINACLWLNPSVPCTSPAVAPLPASVNSCGAAITLTANATGTAPLSYRWRKNGAAIVTGAEFAGEATASLTISPVTAADAASYDVVVTNSCGSVTSTATVVTKNAAPLISASPVAAAACPGASVQLTVTATGTPAPSYQWRKGGVALANSGSFDGATTATLTISPLTTAEVGSYDVVVSNTCGSVPSGSAAVTLQTCAGCSLADIAGGGPTGRTFDGTVDGSDFVAFINSFALGDVAIDPLADVAGAGPDGLSPDGTIDGSDFVAFINAFALGC